MLRAGLFISVMLVFTFAASTPISAQTRSQAATAEVAVAAPSDALDGVLTTLQGPDVWGHGVLVVHYNAGVTVDAATDSNIAFYEFRPTPLDSSPLFAPAQRHSLSMFVVAPTSDGSNLPPELLTLDARRVASGEPGFAGQPAAWTLDFHGLPGAPASSLGPRLHTVLHGSVGDGIADFEVTAAAPGQQRYRIDLAVEQGLAHTMDGLDVQLATGLAWDGADFTRRVGGLGPIEPVLVRELLANAVGISSEPRWLSGSADPGFVTLWTAVPDGGSDVLASTGVNELSLDLVPDQDCFTEDDMFVIELNMSNLDSLVTGFFASVTYDPTLLELQASSAYTLAPFPLHIIDPIADTGAPPGTILLDGSKGFGEPGTGGDALLATMVFKVLPGNDGVSTSVYFSPGGLFPSELSYEGDPLATLLIDSNPFTIDQTAPSIACEPDVSVSNDPGLCSAIVDLTPPLAADDCGLASLVGVRSDGLELSDPYPAGCAPGNTVTVTWTATDIAGLTASCDQTVTVTDTEDPDLTVPDDILAYADGGGVSAEVDYVATATDNCDTDPEVTCVPPSGSTFPLGVTVVTCTATDECGNTTMDSFTVEIIAEPECFLVIGDGPGSASFFDISHLFDTQVDLVEDQYPVLMDDIPEFVIPMPGRVHSGGPGQLSQGSFTGAELGTAPLEASPEWMLDGHFAVQVLMWNPTVFPGQPEQFTAGLEFDRQPDGSWVATPYGTDLGGMTIWHEIGTNAAGQKVIRFPFDIPGW